MPIKPFGSDTTWLKGRMTQGLGSFVYINIYQATALIKENLNDYTILDNGHVFKVYDCEIKDDLTEIEPGA